MLAQNGRAAVDRLAHASDRAKMQPKTRSGQGTWTRRDAVVGSVHFVTSWNASAEIPDGGSGACSTTTWKRFHEASDTLSFTLGRSPEECNEVPRVVWRPEPRSVRRAPLPALYDFNVSQVWSTANYFVFGLDADYELGSHAERLAFWNLNTGMITVTPIVHWESEEWDRHMKRALFGVLSSWRDARVAETNGRITIRNEAECLQVWPVEQAYASCSGARTRSGSP